MKGGIFRKLYMKVRLFFLGLEFPLEDRLFDCRHADFQGALAQSRKSDELQIVHADLGDNNFAAYVYSIPLNRIIGKLGRQLTQDLLRVFKKGFCLDGEISMIGKDEDGFFRCEIRIFDRASFMLPYLSDLPYLTSESNE